MGIAQSPCAVEPDPCGINYSTGKNQSVASRCHIAKEARDKEQANPTHPDVKGIGNAGVVKSSAQHERQTDQGQQPFKGEEQNSPMSAKSTESERRIGPRDKSEDRGMVKNTRNLLRPRRNKPVIDRRSQKQNE